MEDGKDLYIHLAANPSHLEAVNSIVLGGARAHQLKVDDTTQKQVLPLLIHGDAAMFQGSVRYDKIK